MTTAQVITGFAEGQDEQFLRRLNRGDEAAFLAVYRRYQGPLFRFALRMSGSESLAEDVVQEVFLTLIHGQHGYSPEKGTLGGYLYGITRNHVMGSLRKQRFQESLEEEAVQKHSDGTDPLADLSREQQAAMVRQALLSLPLHYREAVALCDLDELPYQEAAAIMGCPVGTVRSRLARGRELLLNRLRDLRSGR